MLPWLFRHLQIMILQFSNILTGKNDNCLPGKHRHIVSARYGENPHQKGIFFGDTGQIFEKLHGKEISYNNLLDLDAAHQSHR